MDSKELFKKLSQALDQPELWDSDITRDGEICKLRYKKTLIKDPKNKSFYLWVANGFSFFELYNGVAHFIPFPFNLWQKWRLWQKAKKLKKKFQTEANTYEKEKDIEFLSGFFDK
ncbi:hypothetical protein [Wielerella bovis]|uniref:hypothetical protein n=1 Tax=Wielerella bovis TaxID=2917790 RepID=UPI0020190CD0|nr:hypothetical protein [Wielerella bovis]ULJ64014.1 hypothetical protein MIS33_07540 [Wielerella bovis]ULJ67526.1 hypothetical protein MIS31_02920 [Wielerella bovis]